MSKNTLPPLVPVSGTFEKYVVWSYSSFHGSWQSHTSRATLDEAKRLAEQFRAPTRIAHVRMTTEILSISEA